jgi:hypothetical protein
VVRGLDGVFDVREGCMAIISDISFVHSASTSSIPNGYQVPLPPDTTVSANKDGQHDGVSEGRRHSNVVASLEFKL